MMQGAIGWPEGGFPKVLQKIILDSAGAKPVTGRLSAKLPKADFAAIKKDLTTKLHNPPREVDVLSHILYPQVFADFDKHLAKYSDTSVLPTPHFFFGLQP